MASPISLPIAGGCNCQKVRYQIEATPLIVHCCHCSWCQRETGTAFALNAVIESSNVTHLGAEPEIILTPSASGRGQGIARCPTCHIAVYSNYDGLDDLIYIRVGTLDTPNMFPPDIHIFAASKQPWVVLGDGVPVVEEFYNRKDVWAPDKLERLSDVLRKAGRM